MARRKDLGANDHVDIIRNQWSAGTQAVEARVAVVDGRVRVRGALAAQWRERLVGGFAEAGLPDPQAAPEQFVVLLHERYSNDYFYATEPHDRGSCPFARRRILPMPGVAEMGREATLRR
jgi:hypothetical protein